MSKPSLESETLTQEFARPLFEYYGIRIAHCTLMRSVVGIVSEDGYRYIWKPVRSRAIAENLSTVAAVVGRLQRLGVEAAGPLAARTGGFLSAVNSASLRDASAQRIHRQGNGLRNEQGHLGYLQPWLEGRHVRLDDRQERLGTLASVAVLHRFTRDIRQDRTQRTLLEMKLDMKRSFLLRSFPKLVQSFPAVRDLEGWLLHGVEASRRAMASLHGHSRRAMTISFCHRDLAAHNLLWQEQRVAIIDFDLAAPDDALGDVVQIANHALQHGGMARADWMELFQVYADLTGISAMDSGRLFLLVQFPDVLARACAEWMKAPSPELEARVLRAVDIERIRLEFCR